MLKERKAQEKVFSRFTFDYNTKLTDLFNIKTELDTVNTGCTLNFALRQSQFLLNIFFQSTFFFSLLLEFSDSKTDLEASSESVRKGWSSLLSNWGFPLKGKKKTHCSKNMFQP